MDGKQVWAGKETQQRLSAQHSKAGAQLCPVPNSQLFPAYSLQSELPHPTRGPEAAAPRGATEIIPHQGTQTGGLI